MKATSIESSLPFEKKPGLALACELQPQISGPGQNGVAQLPATATASLHHQSEDARRFLLESSGEFVSRDSETTLKRLAIQAVPFLADFCFFDVLATDGTIQRVSWAHASTVEHELFELLHEFVPERSSIVDPVSKVLRSGQPEFVPEVNDAWMWEVATSQRQFELMRDLQLRSLIAVPLQVRGGTLGVLTFCYSGSSGRRYCREDLWVVEDLAHRAAMVVENARLYHDLQAASRRKDEFLAMLGHELRNPLAPIRNAARIICLKSPELQGLTEMIERQIQQLTRLVDDLIDVSRVGHGKINLQMKPVDLKVVVALAIEMSRPLIDRREHVLEISLPRRAVEVAGDAGRLAQVVSNLLNNSVKYSDDGSRIELTVEANGDQAILRVSDMGIGIEPAMLPRIFDLFTQVKDSTSRAEEGLGIGLALVRNMIELHGGCVQAASAGLGHGSEFVVRLPLLSRMPAGHPAAAARHRSAWTAPRRRILVIDDNKDATDSMALLLRLAGHEVKTAYDGWTALALARLHPPDVVICDISMPGMSGLDLARHMRQELGLGDSLLVALSGHGQEEDHHRSQEAGFNAFLAKPVRLDLLKALLASHDFLAAGSQGAYQTPRLAP